MAKKETHDIEQYKIVDMVWILIKQLYPRNWITDIKAIYNNKEKQLYVYFCLNIEKYQNIYEYNFSGYLLIRAMKKAGFNFQNIEERTKYTLDDIVFNNIILTQERDDTSALLLIDLAWPYIPGESEFYSAKNKKIFESPVPPTLKIIEEDNEKVLTINPCTIFGKSKITNPMVEKRTLDLYGWKYGPLLVTHCFNTFQPYKFNISKIKEALEKTELEESQVSMAESIKQCGGLLFPSVAISEYPATQFGFNVMVLNTEIIKSWFLKRPKVSRTLPYYIYNTDAFTGTSKEYFNSFAVSLYEECYNGFQWMKEHLSSYGAYQRISVYENKYDKSEEVQIVKTEKELVRSLSKKKKIMDKILKLAKKDIKLAEEAFEKLDTHDTYWLSEIKFSKILDINCFLDCYCPDFMYKNTSIFLTRLGFTGNIISVKLSDELREKMMRLNYLEKYELEYASLVREAILNKQ